ncbi:MAG: hypothetical protein ACOYB1_18465 [Limnohabitans sp.]
MSKALIAAAVSQAIVAGTHTFAVTDPGVFKTLKIDGIRSGDLFNLVRQNYAANGWEKVTDGQGQIHLTDRRRIATPAEIGTYSIEGYANSPITLWTEEM